MSFTALRRVVLPVVVATRCVRVLRWSRRTKSLLFGNAEFRLGLCGPSRLLKSPAESEVSPRVQRLQVHGLFSGFLRGMGLAFGQLSFAQVAVGGGRIRTHLCRRGQMRKSRGQLSERQIDLADL